MAPIGYLMSRYPSVSHAFIVREVEHLRAAGVDVETISIRRVPADDLLAAADRRAASTTFSVLPARPTELFSAHVDALVRSPRRYLGTLARALRASAPGARERLWHLFYFAEAMIVVRHCRRVGIGHLHAQFADAATDVAMLVTHYRRGEMVDGRECTWSLAVHGPVEFYDVTRYALPVKLADARFATAISDFGRSQLMTLTTRWSHLHVVRCGVDPAVYAPPPSRHTDDGRAEILYVGRLLRHKGLPILLESLAALRRRGLQVRVVVVGDGPARRAFEADARRLGVARHVEFRGAVGQDEIRALYERADIFCLPSFAEGVPVVAMEAMAMELPVVTTRIMGIPELVDDGVHGLLVPPGRPDRLAEALEALARSPARRREMGSAGREKVVRDYDVALSARRMRAVLESELELSFAGSE
jgi:glycosyltransferase involved in cell wall biosynthesis